MGNRFKESWADMLMLGGRFMRPIVTFCSCLYHKFSAILTSDYGLVIFAGVGILRFNRSRPVLHLFTENRNSHTECLA
jgi:hypothetical protein